MEIGYYVVKKTRIWLMDIIDIKQDFSVVDWLNCFKIASEKVYQKNKIPIVVGGTAFYIDSLIKPADSFKFGKIRWLRKLLPSFKLEIVQKIYKILEKDDWEKLNNSEKHNKQRLVRRIELALVKKVFKKKFKKNKTEEYDYLHICLKGSKKLIGERIEKRVKKRLEQGLLKEIKSLLKTYQWTDPGLNSLAYKEFRPYFEEGKRVDLNELITEWIQDEKKYAKRQMTWLKNKSKANCFDIGDKVYKLKIKKLVKEWLMLQ